MRVLNTGTEVEAAVADALVRIQTQAIEILLIYLIWDNRSDASECYNRG